MQYYTRACNIFITWMMSDNGDIYDGVNSVTIKKVLFILSLYILYIPITGYNSADYSLTCDE